MKKYTWYDFSKMSKASKKQFLIDIKDSAIKEGRFSMFLYNLHAGDFGLEKIDV